MISPELVRRYRFFWCIDDGQQKAIAMISDVTTYPKGSIIYKEGDEANVLYFLMSGSVALSIALDSEEEKTGRTAFVGEINPDEAFGVSALLHGQRYKSTAQATTDCQVLTIDAEELRELCAMDCKMGYCMLQQVLRATIDRLYLTLVQLAAAHA